MASTQSTQPFSDVSQPGADLEELASSLLGEPASSPIDLALVRVFVKCHLLKHSVSVATYPDGAWATRLDHDILAVSQSMHSAGCDITMPAFLDDMVPTHVRLYFDPSRDTFTAQNMSQEGELAFEPAKSVRTLYQAPAVMVDLEPGVWTILSPSTRDISAPPTKLLDLYLQPRRFWTAANTADAQSTAPGSKRSQAQGQAGDPLSKKQKAPEGGHHVQASAASHPLLEINDGETVQIIGQDRDDCYSLTRKKLLASTPFASLYTAEISPRPDQVVVIKTFKLGCGAHSALKQWYREVKAHQAVREQRNIVHLFSSDARTLSLHLEFIDSPSLDRYIDGSDMCSCSRAAFTILSDIASALQSIHSSGFAHNDIKPSNIVYHKARGAVIIDFGMGGGVAEMHNGGTPWYLAPEYVNQKVRGAPGDIFALGVTMLWVMGKCSLPDKGQGWLIADIHGKGLFDAQARAQGRMHRWLGQVETMRSQLAESERSIESVVRGMLTRERRSTAGDAVKGLKSVTLDK